MGSHGGRAALASVSVGPFSSPSEGSVCPPVRRLLPIRHARNRYLLLFSPEPSSRCSRGARATPAEREALAMLGSVPSFARCAAVSAARSSGSSTAPIGMPARPFGARAAGCCMTWASSWAMSDVRHSCLAHTRRRRTPHPDQLCTRGPQPQPRTPPRAHACAVERAEIVAEALLHISAQPVWQRAAAVCQRLFDDGRCDGLS